MSTWLPNAFVMSLSKKTLRSLKEGTVDSLGTDLDQQESGIRTSSFYFEAPVYRKDTLFYKDKEGNEQIGHLIFKEEYTSKFGDHINLKLMGKLKEEVQKVHSYALNKLNLKLDSLFKFRVFDGNGELKEGTEIRDYKVNYETLEFEIPYAASDFVVALYLNRLAYESIKTAMEEDKNFFRGNYLTDMFVNIGRVSGKVKIKSFINKDQQYKSSDDMALRIETAYGTGYIDTKTATEKDGYKICVGFDADGQPIIREFTLK